MYVYYTLVAFAFYLSFTCEQVPFYGLLPEMAPSDKDRMKIRQAMAVWGTTGNITIGVVPIMLELVIKLGVDETTAWAVTMGILGAIGATTFLVAWHFSKGFETPPEMVSRPKENIGQVYKKIIMYKGLVPSVLTYLICTVFINIIFACIIYITANKLGLPPIQQSIITWCYTFAGVAFTPLITIMDNKMGCVRAFNWTVIVTVIAYVACGLIGLNSVGILVFHGVLTAAAFVLFTAFQYGMFYQVIDVAYLRDGDQVEGSVVAFATFGYKIGAAISSLSVGLALQLVGYDPESPSTSPEVIGRLDSLLTYIPAVLIFVCFLLIKFAYPISKPVYEKILEEKTKKMAGEPYSIDFEEFKKIM